MMGPFLMLLGIGLLYVAVVKGKSDEFLGALGIKMPPLSQEINSWAKKNIWDPLGKTIHDALPAFLRIGG